MPDGEKIAIVCKECESALGQAHLKTCSYWRHTDWVIDRQCKAITVSPSSLEAEASALIAASELLKQFNRFLQVCGEGGKGGRAMDCVDLADWNLAVLSCAAARRTLDAISARPNPPAPYSPNDKDGKFIP